MLSLIDFRSGSIAFDAADVINLDLDIPVKVLVFKCELRFIQMKMHVTDFV